MPLNQGSWFLYHTHFADVFSLYDNVLLMFLILFIINNGIFLISSLYTFFISHCKVPLKSLGKGTLEMLLIFIIYLFTLFYLGIICLLVDVRISPHYILKHYLYELEHFFGNSKVTHYLTCETVITKRFNKIHFINKNSVVLFHSKPLKNNGRLPHAVPFLVAPFRKESYPNFTQFGS